MKSEGDEDPLFNDDWAAAVPLYADKNRPPVTLLVITIGSNIIFDPSKEELAVAESVLALSIGKSAQQTLRLLSIRTIDPPSRLTPPGVPNSLNSATGGTQIVSTQETNVVQEAMDLQGIWRPPRGGMKRGLVAKVIKLALEKDGVAEEILNALEGVES